MPLAVPALSLGLDGAGLDLLLELLNPAVTHADVLTLDREAQELEPVVGIQPLHFLRVQAHLHPCQLVGQDSHRLVGIPADKEHVVRIAHIVAIELAQLLVDMIQQHVGQPTCHAAALLQALVLLAHLVRLAVDIQVRVIVLAQHIYQLRVTEPLLHAVERRVDELDRHRVEVLAQIRLPPQRPCALRFCRNNSRTRLLHHLSAAYPFQVALAGGMHAVRHQLKQQVIRNREQHPVRSLVHIHRAPLTRRVLGNLRRVRRRNLIRAVGDSLVHPHPHLRLAQLV